MGQPLGFDLIDRAFGSDIGSNMWDDFYGFITNPFDITGSNAAQIQYQNQMALNKDSQLYNSLEAQKQRDWEQNMDATKYQRTVADLRAAGLNPYLALGNMGGAGAPSGSSAASSSGSASMANNKLAAAAGALAIFLRYFLTKGK